MFEHHPVLSMESALVACLACAAVFLTGTAVEAQPTCALPVSAYLTDGTGAPLTGTTDLELRFYTEADEDALPAECRALSDVPVESGWIRVVLDACAAPDPADCGVQRLDSLFQDADSVLVGMVVGEAADELSPRLVVGAAPFAIQAADSGTLAGLGPEAFEPSGAVDTHASDDHAHHSATSVGLDITPDSVAVGTSRFDDGALDLGPDSDDELTAEIVRTLTGGGDADTLHTHAAGHGSSGGCYTVWGENTCAEGWSAVYSGIGLVTEHVNTETVAGLHCVVDTAVVETSSISRHYRMLGPASAGVEGDYRPSAGELLCAVCCQ